MDKRNLKNTKIYKMELEGDIYKICPAKNSLTETDEIFKK